MCWNFEISIFSAIYGWLICIILYLRNRPRDIFYSRYLFTFTFTQIIDGLLWYNNDYNTKLEGCSNYQFQIMDYPKNNQFNNYIISKYLLPIAIFCQHSIQCTYPSNLLSKKGERKKLIAFHLIPVLCICFSFACSILYRSEFPMKHETL